MEQVKIQAEVILGVDTHLDVHVGVVIDAVGRVQGTLAIATNPSGYEQLLDWAQGFGVLRLAGVEGTGSYGSGLTRFLEERGITVIEVNRPDRSRRRSRGKSDPTDAESAARAVLADDAKCIPKAQSGLAEALRTLNVARRSAVKAKTQAVNQLRALLVSAPSFIRDVVLKVKPEDCVAACAALPRDDESPVLASLKTTLQLLAKRWTALHEELRELDKQLARLTKLAAPRLLARFGVGPQTAATLLVTAGDNPSRLRNEAALGGAVRRQPARCVLGKVDPTSAQSGRPAGRRIMPCGRSRWFECAATLGRVSTSLAARARASQRKRSIAASSATLFASCTR